MNFRWAYYRRAAENAGVPPDDIPDAMQDIALRVWRADRDDVTVVRRAAVDAARRYGPHTRKGRWRQTLSLSHLDTDMQFTSTPGVSDSSTFAGEVSPEALFAPDVIEPMIMLRAVLEAIGRLSPGQRKALMRGFRGGRDLNRDSVLRYQARRRLRELCA